LPAFEIEVSASKDGLSKVRLEKAKAYATDLEIIYNSCIPAPQHVPEAPSQIFFVGQVTAQHCTKFAPFQFPEQIVARAPFMYAYKARGKMFIDNKVGPRVKSLLAILLPRRGTVEVIAWSLPLGASSSAGLHCVADFSTNE
jgi:hypothetical protein